MDHLSNRPIETSYIQKPMFDTAFALFTCPCYLGVCCYTPKGDLIFQE